MSRDVLVQEDGVDHVLALLRREMCRRTPADVAAKSREFIGPNMKRRLGKAGFHELFLRFEQCYFELGQALKTLDESVEINNLFHPTLRGLLIMACSLLNPTEQAAVSATAGNSMDYYLVKLALSDQWPEARLLSRDGRGRRQAHPIDYGYGLDYVDYDDGYQEYDNYSKRLDETEYDGEEAWGADVHWYEESFDGEQAEDTRMLAIEGEYFEDSEPMDPSMGIDVFSLFDGVEHGDVKEAAQPTRPGPSPKPGSS